MRKIMSLLLVLLMLVALLLTGCAGVEDSGEESHLLPEEQEGEAQRAMDRFDLTINIEDPEDLATPGQEKLMQELLTRWYTFIGTYTEVSFDSLFDPDYLPDNGVYEADQHEISCRTLVAIRQAALEDLHLEHCVLTLTVQKADWADGCFRIDALENTTMKFEDVPMDSELIDLPHIFELLPTEGDDSWLIHHHEADDNPYFSATYAEENDVDENLPIMLRNIERRHLLRDETAQVELSCQNKYNRATALTYMLIYSCRRNDAWEVYDDVGGNCMNFASQVLLAGEIPMDTNGSDQWYWNHDNDLDLSFINVEKFVEYARRNTGYGLVADIDANYYEGEIGDLLIFGINSDRHATVICGLIKDNSDRVVDYMICSNTTNYRYFPAAAYYYTGQRLVKIYGWNSN